MKRFARAGTGRKPLPPAGRGIAWAVLLSCLLTLLFALPARAAQPPSSEYPPSTADSSAGLSAGSTPSPVLVAAAMAGVTGASLLADSPDRWGRALARVFADPATDFGNTVGSGGTLVLGTAALWTFGRWKGDVALAGAGTALTRSLAVDAITVLSIKAAVRRRRPDGSDRYSFPSGHSSGAFTAATVLQNHFGSHVGLPAYAVASLVAFSRVEDRKHYFSDVVAGALLGTWIAKHVDGTPSTPRPAVLAMPDGGLGVGLKIRF
jgi:membrane-associated phospholipid phosphatase